MMEQSKTGMNGCRKSRLGAGAPGHDRSNLLGRQRVLPVEDRLRIGRQARPSLHRGIELAGFRRIGPTLQVSERLFVGGDGAAPAAGLDRHVAECQSRFDRKVPDGRACIFDGMPLCAIRADPSYGIDLDAASTLCVASILRSLVHIDHARVDSWPAHVHQVTYIEMSWVSGLPRSSAWTGAPN